MADKTTTLKTKTNDNVYPNVIGDNRDNAIVNSAHINHTLTADHKINFRLDTNISNLIFNSLQKPAGLTKTKLVGVGTNGQENIEIGDNLTLANGKLSATGGGYDEITFSNDWSSCTGTITGTKPVLINKGEEKILTIQKLISNSASIFFDISINDNKIILSEILVYNNQTYKEEYKILAQLYHHFITMTNSTDNVALYLTIQNTSEDRFTENNLASYLAGKKVLANGNLHGVVPTHIAGEGDVIKIYYMTPGDSNINPTPDEYQDLSSFTITDLVAPV